MSDTTAAPSSFSAPSADPAHRAPAQFASGPVRLRERASARLFGQFLLDHEAVTRAELSAALGLMASLNETVGELAVSRGWLSRPQADRIAQMQRTIDARWGDIAIALDEGGLSPEQVEQLLWEQTEDNLRVGDALVEVGALSCSYAEEWTQRYEASRSLSVVMADDPGGDYDPIRFAVDGLPRVVLRRAGLHAACAIPRVFRRDLHDDSGKHAATIVVRGDKSVELGLSLSVRLARAVAQGARGQCGVSEDAVCDLVEVLAVYVAHQLDAQEESGAAAWSVGQARRGQLPEQGLVFAVATDHGDGMLVVRSTTRNAE